MPVITSGLMRIGRDAEVRYVPSGQPIVTLSLAFNYGKKADDGGRPTQWVEAAYWGDYAAKAAPNMLKGVLIHAILEDIHIEEFKKRDGSPGFKLAARMQNFDYAGPRQDGQQNTAPASASAQRTAPAARPATPPSNRFEDDDDSIPF